MLIDLSVPGNAILAAFIAVAVFMAVIFYLCGVARRKTIERFESEKRLVKTYMVGYASDDNSHASQLMVRIPELNERPNVCHSVEGHVRHGDYQVDEEIMLYYMDKTVLGMHLPMLVFPDKEPESPHWMFVVAAASLVVAIGLSIMLIF